MVGNHIRNCLGGERVSGSLRNMPSSRFALDFLRMRVGPLLRHVADVDVAEATFTSKLERLRYQVLANKVPA